jgi:capsule polysaccharide export protein KpsE/RkpR
MEQNDKIASLLNVLYRNRNRLLILAAITFVVTAAIALTMPNYYKSETVFYPTSEDMMKPEMIFGGGDRDLRYYGTDLELDRLLSISESPHLLDFLIEEFNLAERYGIKDGSRERQSRLRNKLRKHYDVKKTRHGAVELSIEDTEPEVAAQMTRAAREKVSEIATSIIRTAQAEMIETIEKSIEEKETLLVEFKDSLRTLREKFGIFSAEAQAEQYSTIITKIETDLQKERVRFERLSANPNIPRDTIAYLEADLMGLEQQYRFLTGEGTEELTGLQRFNQGVGLVEIINNRFQRENTQLTYDRMRLKNVKAAYNAPYSAVFVLQEAIVPDQKSRPKRSIIVGGAVLGVLVFATFGLLLFHSIDPKLAERIRKG